MNQCNDTNNDFYALFADGELIVSKELGFLHTLDYCGWHSNRLWKRDVRGFTMNQYKDTTHKPNMLKTQNKRHSERFINALLDCLLVAGMMLFSLLVVTSYQPA